MIGSPGYRTREHLTEAEVERLIEATTSHRDATPNRSRLGIGRASVTELVAQIRKRNVGATPVEAVLPASATIGAGKPQHRADLRIFGKQVGAPWALATPVFWLRERTLALFQVTGLSVPLQRFSVPVEGAVFAAFFHEARWPGERLSVFAHRPSRTGALGDGRSNAEQQKQNRSYGRPAHSSLQGRLPFPIHAHMPRHSAGYALAGRGVDTRTLQAFMGHRSIANTVIYTAVADKRLRHIWDR